MKLTTKHLILWLGQLAALSVLALCVLAGCGPDQPSTRMTMTFEVEPNPPVVGPAHLTVKLTDSAGAPVTGAVLNLEGTMDHAGMSPRLAVARGDSAGRYEAPFVWTMPGQWQLTATALLPDGQKVAQQFNLTVDQPALGHTHDDADRLPNHGAAIRIVSPADGAVVQPGAEVRLEVTTENFKLGEEGRHWHVYIDGQSPQMIMGGATEVILRDLAPGEHEISAYLSGDSHQDLAEGDAIMLMVGAPPVTQSGDEGHSHSTEMAHD